MRDKCRVIALRKIPLYAKRDVCIYKRHSNKNIPRLYFRNNSGVRKEGAHKHLERSTTPTIFRRCFTWKMQTLPILDPVGICCLRQKNKKACVIVDIFTNLKRRIGNGLLLETFWNLRKSRGKNWVATLVELVGKKNMLPSCMLTNDLTPMENSGVLHGSFRQKIQETYNISREVAWNMEDYYQTVRKNFERRKF